MYNDPRLGLSWPLEVSVISEKDHKFAAFDDVEATVKKRMTVA